MPDTDACPECGAPTVNGACILKACDGETPTDPDAE